MSFSSGAGRYFFNPSEDYLSDTELIISYDDIKDDILSNVYLCIEEQKRVQSGIKGGLYTGTYGNAYTLYHLSKKATLAEYRHDFLNTASELIATGISIAVTSKIGEPVKECSFLSGKAGIFALGAVIFKEAGVPTEECINDFIRVGAYCISPDYADFGGDEFFVGRAGYLYASLWLNRVFHEPVIPQEIINKLCDSIIASGTKYSEVHQSPVPLMFHYHRTQYLGAAHGLASILFVLLTSEEYLSAHQDVEMIIKKCVDFFLRIQQTNGNFPPSVEEIGVGGRGVEELVHWCHGGPGVIYLLLKSYLRWNEEKYLASAIRVGELIWEKGLLKKGPGICHGVGGNGYAFLALYRVTNETKYIYRANEFVKFMKTSEFQNARTPDNPYSLFEGYAGTLCFLADVVEPETATFPFMDFML